MACPQGTPLLGCCNVNTNPFYLYRGDGIYAYYNGYQNPSNTNDPVLYRNISAQYYFGPGTESSLGTATASFTIDDDGNESVVSFTEDALFAVSKMSITNVIKVKQQSVSSPKLSPAAAFALMRAGLDVVPAQTTRPATGTPQLILNRYRYRYVPNSSTLEPIAGDRIQTALGLGNTYARYEGYSISEVAVRACAGTGRCVNSATSILSFLLFAVRCRVWTAHLDDPPSCYTVWTPNDYATNKVQRYCSGSHGSQSANYYDGYELLPIAADFLDFTATQQNPPRATQEATGWANFYRPQSPYTCCQP
jgi:hypothetical protein